MYILDGRGLGEYTPWRVRVGLQPKPQQLLPFLSLDNFGFDKSSLIADHVSKIDGILVNTVEASWKTMQPIDLIRLVGHADDTGPDEYNVGLGNRRAEAVAAALLKIYPRGGRVKIALDPSPGESQPTADKRTPDGKARNRRVEVFIESGGQIVSTPPKPPQPPWPPKPPNPPDPGDSVVVTKRDPMWDPIPPGLPGRSLKERLIELCSRHFPKAVCPTMVNQILNGSCHLLEELLARAGATLGEKQKQELRQQCRDAARRPIR